jgi:transposase-like protein
VGNVLSVVPKGSQEMVASNILTIFAQPDSEHVQKQFDEVDTMLGDARADLLAFAAFPRRHWRQIWSTNPLERVNK